MNTQVMKQLREAIDREGKFRITAEFEGDESLSVVWRFSLWC